MACRKLLRWAWLLCIWTAAGMAQETHAIRAAIDIGMGGPKLQVAEVDLESKKIVRVLHTQSYFVNFYDSILQSAQRELSSEVMAQGMEAFQHAVEMAGKLKAGGVVAIATEAFRAAANGEEFAEKIYRQTGIRVHIVDQELEGKLAFGAALAKLDAPAEDLLVWDIGGGSIQFIFLGPDGSYCVDCGREGAGAFRDFIISKAQRRSIQETATPNPMSREEISAAKEYARQLSCRVGRGVREKAGDRTVVVAGVGNVFARGVAVQAEEKNPLSVEDLKNLVDFLPGKTDADLGGGDYAFCEGSNLILALGFMEELQIQRLHIVKANNADGALLYEPFW